MDPRERRTRARVMAAASALLMEGGPEAITHSAVAGHSGVGRTTMYRHWPNHGALMTDILETLSADLVSTLTDDTRADLVAGLISMTEMLAEQQTRARMLTLLSRAQHNEQAANTLRQLDSGSPMRVVLDRGIQSGLLPSDLDIDEAMSRLVGPVMHARLVAQREVHPDEIERVVDNLLEHPSTTSSVSTGTSSPI